MRVQPGNFPNPFLDEIVYLLVPLHHDRLARSDTRTESVREHARVRQRGREFALDCEHEQRTGGVRRRCMRGGVAA